MSNIRALHYQLKKRYEMDGIKITIYHNKSTFFGNHTTWNHHFSIHAGESEKIDLHSDIGKFIMKKFKETPMYEHALQITIDV